MIPSSGGAYSYILAAYGRAPAFVYLWMSLFLEEANMLAIDALTFGTYVLQPFFPDSQTPPEIPVRLMAAVIIREAYFFLFMCFEEFWVLFHAYLWCLLG